ncbi:MAG: C40 family peptidase, partial [Xanthomonadales bacterium]|nr:C40 family peptidase [Xanthomonadales bacterium]
VSALYAAWIQANQLALGSRQEVFAYTHCEPCVVVTGAKVSTVYSPEAPQVSNLLLDMGVRVPLIADWPVSKLVNGQLPYASHVVALPVRGRDGALQIVPALLPRSADVSANYLPLTRANLIRQAFKFLGERYGWGHSYGTRDCSGFVSEVYRSFGVTLPRNTRDQGVTIAFDRIVLDDTLDHAARVEIMRSLDVGDLIYIPGHVMMVIGHDAGETWLIHDTTGTHVRNAAGSLISVPINQVAVTPLFALLGESGTPYIDFAYSVQRIRLVDHP